MTVWNYSLLQLQHLHC